MDAKFHISLPSFSAVIPGVSFILQSWSVFKQAYHLKPGRIGIRVLFDLHTYLAHHSDRGGILIRRRRHNASQAKLRERVANQRFCRFCSVSLSPVGGGKGIKEAEFCRVEVCSSVFVSGAQSRQLPERSETRHKATRSDDLHCLLQYNGPIAIGWLIEPGQRFVVQYRPLQPLLTLFAGQHSLAAKIR